MTVHTGEGGSGPSSGADDRLGSEDRPASGAGDRPGLGAGDRPASGAGDRPGAGDRARRRDRHGRGLRGRLVPPGVPLYRSRAEQFDDLVLEAVARL